MKKEYLLTTCFGLGKLPVAPGTWGSLPPVITYMILATLWPAANSYVMGFFVIAGAWACVRFAPVIVAQSGKKDPGMIVADEVSGQAVTMLLISLMEPDHICITAGIGFLLFRLFDIFKPWPCKKLEKLPNGLGILADDLMAGFYGAVCFGIGYSLLLRYSG